MFIRANRDTWAKRLTDQASALSDEQKFEFDENSELDINWHFIGRLQRNKVRQVVGVATLIHSLDRPVLARALGKETEVSR